MLISHFSLAAHPMGGNTILLFYLAVTYEKIKHTLQLPEIPKMLRKITPIIHC